MYGLFQGGAGGEGRGEGGQNSWKSQKGRIVFFPRVAPLTSMPLCHTLTQTFFRSSGSGTMILREEDHFDSEISFGILLHT